MEDTSAKIAAKYRGLLMKKTPYERILMVSDMHAAVRTLQRVALQHKVANETEMRVALFLRTYGSDYSEEARNQIINRIRRRRDI